MSHCSSCHASDRCMDHSNRTATPDSELIRLCSLSVRTKPQLSLPTTIITSTIDNIKSSITLLTGTRRQRHVRTADGARSTRIVRLIALHTAVATEVHVHARETRWHEACQLIVLDVELQCVVSTRQSGRGNLTRQHVGLGVKVSQS